MPAPATADDLLGLLRKSNLLEHAKLEAFLTTNPGIEDSPSALCQKLKAHGLLTPFQTEQLMKGKHKGFFLGKYKILDRIGLGGMGQVFLAEHTSMRRRVALKVMPPDRAENQFSRERFLREARAAGQLDHPNLVRAYDVDTENDVIFLVMEFVDGVSFQELVVRHGTLNADRTAHYLYQAALGLNYMHARGLVHRDIKPANLLVDRQGIVKILDLGLVRSEVEDDNLTRGEGVKMLGTADYLSPEQALDCSKVDVRTDIYSLGATAYFMLTGKPPFDSEKVAQKLLAHQMKTIKPVHEVNPKVPVELSNIINKMLAKQLESRFQTPLELANALETWGHMRIPAPTEQEIPAILGGTVGCASTISLADPRSTSRIGGSSVSLSGNSSSSSSSSSLRFGTEKKPESGKVLQAPVITPIPRPAHTPPPQARTATTPAPLPRPASTPAPAQTPLPRPMESAPLTLKLTGEAELPPSLPATVTHGEKKPVVPNFPPSLPEPKRPEDGRRRVDVSFYTPPTKPESSGKGKILIAVAVVLGMIAVAATFFVLGSNSNAAQTQQTK